MTPEKENDLFLMLGEMKANGENIARDVGALRKKMDAEDKSLGTRLGKVEGDVRSVKRAGMLAAAMMSPAAMKLKGIWAALVG